MALWSPSYTDSLARDGLRFTQFYNNAVCGPTRASLLTGLYCQQIGHRGDRWNEPKDFAKCVTIAELLKKAGYRTMMVGKWQGRDSALDRGFDRFFGPMCQAKISYFNEVAACWSMTMCESAGRTIGIRTGRWRSTCFGTTV